MRKPTLALILSTVSLGACSSLGAANTATETRVLPAFSSIALNGIGAVRIHRGPQSIRVTVDQGLLDRYETKVKGNTLSIGFKCGLATLWAARKVRTCEVDIVVPELAKIELNGAGTIVVDAFSYETVKLGVTGAGSLELRGDASKLEVSCTGAGEVHASDLVSDRAYVSLTGAGRVEVNARNELEASVTGAGEIRYWGSPRLTQHGTGAGGIRRAGD